MSSKPDSIHDFDLDLICRYFAQLDRQGPGSPEITRKALGFINPLCEDAHIADIGCGSGSQTLVLAENAPGRITGIDLFPAFIERLTENAEKARLQDRVMGVVGNMEALPFEEASLDLIWSEGAIYNIGFARGLREWRRFLKPGGHIAVSEASWFTDQRPGEIQDYWMREYPEMDTIPNKLAQLQAAGYTPVATFTIPETCWLEHFYTPQVALQERFLQENADNPAASAFVETQRHEARMYHQYKDFYGYAFYLGKRMH